ncbi:MAG TPA: 50S ribosomal protein L22 [Planctomycetota bacterium]|nr:50S ribosomal protein L22 [Planctomycetota bacterium]
MDFRATWKFARVSPTKVRPLATLVKNMPLNQALTVLRLEKRRGAALLHKVVRAAWANAQEKDSGYDEEAFFVKSARVDKGPQLRRMRARSMGRANIILRRSAHITVILSDSPNEER